MSMLPPPSKIFSQPSESAPVTPNEKQEISDFHRTIYLELLQRERDSSEKHADLLLVPRVRGPDGRFLPACK